jgi:hypothetical protein
MDNWDKPLTYVITPKSGPLRKMESLLDANRALTGELPRGYLKRAHWLRAGQALVTAAETGKSRDIERGFETIVAALDEEGWLPRGVSRWQPPRFEPPRSKPPRFESPRSEPSRFEPPRSVVPSKSAPQSAISTPRRVAEPLWRRIQPRKKQNTLPDVQRLDLAYVSCAAGTARPDGELRRNKTLPDVQRLDLVDLSYVSSAAGPARPDGKLRRNKTLPDVQRLDLAYVSSAAGPARPDGELIRATALFE